MGFSDGRWNAKCIVESQEASEIIDTLRLSYSRFEEVWDGITWLLARSGDKVGTGYRGFHIYKHNGIPGEMVCPALTLVYAVRVDEIEILSIKPSHPTSFDGSEDMF